jgi:hypothetical protein
MSDLEYRSSGLSAALGAGTETNLLANGASGLSLLPSATSGSNAPGSDIVDIALSNAGNLVETITIYLDEVPMSVTSSLAATTGKRSIKLRGATGVLRVTGTSSAGVAGGVTVTVTASRSGKDPAFAIIIDGVVQGASSGGTIVGNFSATSGTITASATGAAVLDASTSVTVGGTSATSLVIGRTAVVPSLPGGVSVATGKAITGSGTLALEATGALTVAGAASTTSSLIGRSGNLTTMVGKTRFSEDIQSVSGDAGVAGTTGTVSKATGTFTLTGTAFTLTNTLITATSLVFASCITASPGAYIASVVPGSGSVVVTFSASVTAIKCAFLVINP